MTYQVRDEFNRTHASSWGTADVGGVYTENTLAAGTTRSTAGTVGRVTWTGVAASTVQQRLAAATASADVRATAQVRFQNTWTTTLGFRILARVDTASTIDAPTAYAAILTVNADGSGNLNLGTLSAGVFAALTVRNYPAGVFTPGLQWRVEFEVTGTSPAVRLRGRVYAAASTPDDVDEPWTEVTDSGALPASGVYQFTATRVAPGANNPVFIDFESLAVTNVPVPAFTATGPGLAWTFTSTSTGEISAYEWTFGDGSTGTGASASHTYAGYGAYVVQLSLVLPWGARVRTQQLVTTTDPTPAAGGGSPAALRPAIRIEGVDMCDSVYAATWTVGRAKWADELRGGSCSIRLRGIVDVEHGDELTISFPHQGAALWVGVISEVRVHRSRWATENETSITADDCTAKLATRHIVPRTTFDAAKLPARLADLLSVPGYVVRAKSGYGGIPASRWPTLKRKSTSADGLRDRTYLDLVRDALQASVAMAYVGRDNAIVYASLEPPAGLTPSNVIDLDAGDDCAVGVDTDADTTDGIVNRWEVAAGGSSEDLVRLRSTSIRRYGERVWSVSDGVLDANGTFPWPTEAMMNAMAQPSAAPVATVNITQGDQSIVQVEPLRFARWGGNIYSVMGVRHEWVAGGVWRVELTLDRNPWHLSGQAVPTLLPADRPEVEVLPR